MVPSLRESPALKMIPEPVPFQVATKNREPHTFAISTTGFTFGIILLLKVNMLLLVCLLLVALQFQASRYYSRTASPIPPPGEKLNPNPKLPSGANLKPYPTPPNSSLSFLPYSLTLSQPFEADLVPEATLEHTPTPPASPTPGPLLYYAQSGDTLQVVALRFGLQPEEITSPDPLPEQDLLNPGQLLLLPPHLNGMPATQRLLPDSEVVYSPSAHDFDVASFLKKASGYLNTHREYLNSIGWTSAADIITRVAVENSINPRILLSILEYTCHCVYGPLDETVQSDYLLNEVDYRHKGLYRQLAWAANQLSAGYYGWRSGSLTEFQLSNDKIAQPAPDLNTGSVALQYFFAQHYDNQLWALAIDPEQGLPALHVRMFGDPWERDRAMGPLFPAGFAQPELILPFQPGKLWSFSSGPHSAWETDGAQAALDFAPAVPEGGCVQSDAWVVAVADGLVVRSGFGAVIQDLPNYGATASDGVEQIGWAILYMHIESRDRVGLGTYLYAGDPIGHPSCEGGRANGTHLHIARKYNGEWVAADGPLPFVLSGWVANAGQKPYQGTLTKDEQTVTARPNGSRITFISIPTDEP